MRTVRFAETNTRVLRQLRWWGSICVVVTILLADAFPLSWVALWPAAFTLGVSLIFLSSLVVEPVKNLVVTVWRVIRSRRHFEDALGAYTSYLHDNLDGLSREIELLERRAAELNSKVNQIPGRAGSLRHVIFLRQSDAK